MQTQQIQQIHAHMMDVNRGFVSTLMKCIGDESDVTKDVIQTHVRAITEAIAEHCGAMLKFMEDGHTCEEARVKFIDPLMHMVIGMESTEDDLDALILNALNE
jgi:hypothetical protein